LRADTAGEGQPAHAQIGQGAKKGVDPDQRLVALDIPMRANRHHDRKADSGDDEKNLTIGDRQNRGTGTNKGGAVMHPARSWMPVGIKIKAPEIRKRNFRSFTWRAFEHWSLPSSL